MLKAYLAELEGELARRLPPEDVQARLVEAEAHLRDGIEGRVELGLSREDAERETVAAFGDSRRVAQAVVVPGEARAVLVRLRWMAAAYCVLGASYAALDWLRVCIPFLAPLMVGAVIVCGAGIAVAAFRTRRAATLPILTTGLAASIAFWGLFGVFWLNLWNYGGMGYHSRFGIEGSMEDMRTRSARPVDEHGVTTDYLRDDLAAIPRAQADPVGNWLSQAGPGFGVGTGYAALIAATDLVAAGLGAAWASSRRRRPTVA